MASIRKRDGKYQVRWEDPDGTLRGKTCPTRASALKLKAEVETSIALGRRWVAPDARQAVDLRTMAAYYYVDCGARNRERTLIRKRQMIDGFVDWFEDAVTGAPTPDRLNHRLLLDYHAHLSDVRTCRYVHGRSPETVRKHIDEVERFWRWAWEFADDYGVEVPTPRSMRLRRQRPRRHPKPTFAEMDAVIRAAKPWQRRLAIVLRCTGLRVQQAMSLCWDDVDLDRGMLEVRPWLGKTMAERVGRTVPLAPVLVEILAGWGVREGYLIDWPHEHRLARARDMKRVWKRSGVRPAVFGSGAHHSFRGGFKTGLRELGADRDAVDFLVGHSLGIDDHYLDPVRALGLRDVVKLVPPIDCEKLVALGSAAR